MKGETQIFIQCAHCSIQMGQESSHCFLEMDHPYEELHPSGLFLPHNLDMPDASVACVIQLRFSTIHHSHKINPLPADSWTELIPEMVKFWTSYFAFCFCDTNQKQFEEESVFGL